MPITHTFSSVIADDPEAASAGAVLPSHWNAPHDIDLAVSDIAGLQAELDAKQVQLLSGTNLKTVGGSSLLGSGDIALPNGVPVGGTTGQILAKNSATDFDTEWVDPQITVSATAPASPTLNQLWLDIS